MTHVICQSTQGQSNLNILRYFSQPHLQADPKCHVLPILQEMQYQDMAFVVMPLLSEGLMTPWFLNIGEALEAMRQTFEVSRLCEPVS